MDYNFKKIEKDWQRFWADNKTFKAKDNSGQPKCFVLDMFPYPSGAGLHVGHPLGYIASDIYSRYKRLKGYNVLHPMGYDSFGLPAEQYAIQTGQHPAVTTAQNIARYREQLDGIGFSFDWDREVRTSDPSYYKWTQWIFIQLFNSWYNNDSNKAESIDSLTERFKKEGNAKVNACHNEESIFTAEEWNNKSEEQQQKILLNYRLAYLADSWVNWCPELGTVLANDEVKDGFSVRGGHPVVQKLMKQWSMRITAYAERLLTGLDTIDWTEAIKEMQRNWIGKSEGASVKFNLIPSPSPKEKGTGYGYETADKLAWNILKENARENRKKPTIAEDIIWQRVRDKQLGYKIRRQHAIDLFIVDFVCLEKKIVIEIDGEYHEGIKEDDQTRTEALNESGFDVIRFTNQEVINDTEKVISEIKKQLDSKVLSFGEDLGEVFIEVFTTRPDTIFGVSFVTLAPEHELVDQITTPEYKEAVDAYKKASAVKSERDRMSDIKTISGQFTGAYVEHPFTGKAVPVWIGDYVLASYGTGAVMAVPAHDTRDYAFAKHFDLPIIEVIEGGDVSNEAYDAKEGKVVNSDFLNGLEVKDAIKKAIQKIEEKNIGKGKINYRLRDAIFGRQRYWGEPIPVYYKSNIPYVMEENELPLTLPEVDKFLPTEDGEPPLARAKDWKYKGEYEYETTTMPGWAGSSWYFFRYMDPKNEKAFADKEHLDYWQNVDLYIGGSEHATGHLLYARFWCKFLNDLGYVNVDEPFRKLINQGMIQGVSQMIYVANSQTNTFNSPDFNYNSLNIKRFLFSSDFFREGINPIEHDNILFRVHPVHVPIEYVDKNNVLDIERYIASPYGEQYKDAVFVCQKGYYENNNFYDQVISHGRTTKENASSNFKTITEVEKMSKSKYNVVNPDDIVERYGADTLRMYEMFLGPLEQSKPWNTNGIEGVFKFLRKFWKLFHDDQWNFVVSDEEPTKAELKALHTIIKKVEEDIERFSFNTSVSSFMICVNTLTDLKCNKRKILNDLVIVLSSYAPHISEELWKLLGNKEGSLSTAAYPSFNPDYLVEDEFAYPISINGKTKMNLSIPLTLDVADIEKEVLANADVQRYLDGKAPKKVIVVKGRIVNIVV